MCIQFLVMVRLSLEIENRDFSVADNRNGNHVIFFQYRPKFKIKINKFKNIIYFYLFENCNRNRVFLLKTEPKSTELKKPKPYQY